VASLVNTFPQSVSGSFASLVAACWEKLLTFLPWCSISNPPLSLVSFRTPCSWDILRGKSIATRDTRYNEYWNCWRNILWVKSESLFFEIRLHSKSPMLYRPSLHGNWNALSLARRALKDKFPTPTFQLTTVLPNRHVFLPDSVLCTWVCSATIFLACVW
jgi:hypothetical protein